jgi:peptidoglycan biosynthesis protein MviN/MurJ (putative lipid II flippase)
LSGYLRTQVRTAIEHFGDAGYVAGGALLASATVLLRDVGISKMLGRTAESDALLAGLLLATTVAQLVPGTFQTSVFPVVVAAKLEHGVDATRRLLGAITLRFLPLTAGLAVVLLLGRRPIANAIATNSGAALADVLGVLGFFVIGLALTELARSLLSLERHFISYALLGSTGNLILLILIWGRRPTDSRETAVLASVAFLAAIPVAWTVCISLGLVRFGNSLAKGTKSQIYRQARPGLAAGLLTIGMSVVDQKFTISLGSGNYSAFALGQRWPLFAAQLPAFALGLVLLRTMSEDAVRLDTEEWRQKIRQSAKLAFAFGMLTSLFGLIIGPLLIRVTLRGGEFSAADAAAVIGVQRVLFLFAPFYITGIVYLRLLNVLRRNGLVLLLGAFSLTLNAFLDWVFTRHWHLGVRGVALATVLVYIFSSSCLVVTGELLLRSANPNRSRI